MKCISVLVLFAQCCASFTVERTVPLSCDAQWDTSSSSMLNIAFQWTQHNELLHWRYKELDENCVQVDYTTHIRIRRMFEYLVPSKMLAATISKHVCVQKNVLQEKVLVSDIVLLESLSINVHATINKKARVLEFLGEADLRVPWFLQMIENTVISQLQDSLREYHELLASELCKGQQGL